jgi:hypothetical protein
MSILKFVDRIRHQAVSDSVKKQRCETTKTGTNTSCFAWIPKLPVSVFKLNRNKQTTEANGLDYNG